MGIELNALHWIYLVFIFVIIAAMSKVLLETGINEVMVSPFELARRNLKPVVIGLAVTTIAAVFLI